MLHVTNWDDSFSTEETNDVCKKISEVLVGRLSDRNLRDLLAGFIASNDIRALCSLEVDYHVLPVTDAIICRQIRAFFEKRDDIDFGIDRKAVALAKFMETEMWCASTNRFIIKSRLRPEIIPGDVHAVLHYARRKIVEILGDLPEFEELRLRFGPGATTTTLKKNACPLNKLGAPFACSERLLPSVARLLEECPGWIPFKDEDSVSVPVLLQAGVLSFVLKNWKTDRTTVKNPPLNVLLQLGYGDWMADRLRVFGQSTRDQSRNQMAARSGSIDGRLATLDLSSASDTIAKELVWELFPYDWAYALNECRTDLVELPNGELLRLQKFSSMGDGFTFPLETLIFYSLAYGCCKVRELDTKAIQVYGDDIIVPTDCFEFLCDTLKCLGFLPNAEKSFHTGPFRESCGADYYKGINIRPCYLDSSFTGESLFALHNFFRRNLEDEVADLLLAYIDPSLRIYGPDGYGDGHLLTPFGQSCDVHLAPSGRRHTHGYGGYTFETFTWKPRKLRAWLKPGDRTLPVYSVYIRHDDDNTEPDSSPPKARSEPFSCNEKGKYSCSLPGTRGYRRMKIYTFGV